MLFARSQRVVGAPGELLDLPVEGADTKTVAEALFVSYRAHRAGLPLEVDLREDGCRRNRRHPARQRPAGDAPAAAWPWHDAASERALRGPADHPGRCGHHLQRRVEPEGTSPSTPPDAAELHRRAGDGPGRHRSSSTWTASRSGDLPMGKHDVIVTITGYEQDRFHHVGGVRRGLPEHRALLRLPPRADRRGHARHVDLRLVEHRPASGRTAACGRSSRRRPSSPPSASSSAPSAPRAEVQRPVRPSMSLAEDVGVAGVAGDLLDEVVTIHRKVGTGVAARRLVDLRAEVAGPDDRVDGGPPHPDRPRPPPRERRRPAPAFSRSTLPWAKRWRIQMSSAYLRCLVTPSTRRAARDQTRRASSSPRPLTFRRNDLRWNCSAGHRTSRRHPDLVGFLIRHVSNDTAGGPLSPTGSPRAPLTRVFGATLR